MADYLKKFATQSDYDAYIQAGYPKPNVSYIVDNDEIIFTNYQDSGEDAPDTVVTGMKIADFTGTTFNLATSYITEAYIPDGVTKISGNAFRGCSGLTSVRIPDSVTSIGEQAFRDCAALTSVTIPDSVTSIGVSVFYNCTSLTSVNIPDSVTSIGEQAFYNCAALTSIDIPDSVTKISNQAFLQCTSLTSVTVRATTPPTLASNAFNSTHANLVIYVPAASVDAYKSASGWSDYASKIQAITE